MRNRLLQNKRNDKARPERAVPLAKNFMIYTLKATNYQRVNKKGNHDHDVIKMIDSAQECANDVYRRLVEAESESNIDVKLVLLSAAMRALDSAEAEFGALRHSDKVTLKNPRFVAISIDNIRVAITKWIRYEKKKNPGRNPDKH